MAGEQKSPGNTEALPTRAGRPETSAPETNAAIRSPSPETTLPEVEAEHSVEPPAYDPVAANMSEPSVEGTARQRIGMSGHKADDDSAKTSELPRRQHHNTVRPH